VLVGVMLVAVAAWQAGSWRVGLIVCAGFIGISGVLWGAGWLLVKMMRPCGRRGGSHCATRRCTWIVQAIRRGSCC
jgi:hypothetical protein